MVTGVYICFDHLATVAVNVVPLHMTIPSRYVHLNVRNEFRSNKS